MTEAEVKQLTRAQCLSRLAYLEDMAAEDYERDELVGTAMYGGEIGYYQMSTENLQEELFHITGQGFDDIDWTEIDEEYKEWADKAPLYQERKPNVIFDGNNFVLLLKGASIELATPAGTLKIEATQDTVSVVTEDGFHGFNAELEIGTDPEVWVRTIPPTQTKVDRQNEAERVIKEKINYLLNTEPADMKAEINKLLNFLH